MTPPYVELMYYPTHKEIKSYLKTQNESSLARSIDNLSLLTELTIRIRIWIRIGPQRLQSKDLDPDRTPAFAK